MSRTMRPQIAAAASPEFRGRNLIPQRMYLEECRRLAEAALREDLGSGDVTSALFEAKEVGAGFFLAKEAGIVSGMELVRAVFRHLSPTAKVRVLVPDGNRFEKGATLAEVRAPVRTLLSGERVSLNFLQRLSGVATLTSRFVEALGPESRIRVLDTRKTTPLLRIVEKMAVVHGGGHNHRLRLDDMAMIKNNHVDHAGGVAAAVQGLRASGFFTARPRVPLCIEARDLAEAVAAVESEADIVLLDNMSPAQAKKVAEGIARRADELGRSRPLVEISGGITRKSIASYRDLPVDRISVGALTHSARALDISFRMKLRKK